MTDDIWQPIFGEISEDVAAIGVALRATIRAVHPDVTEVSYPGYDAVSYGIGPRKVKEGYAYLMPQKDRVNLGFYQGASLIDPAGLLEGTGKALRHIKVRDAGMADSPALRDLLAQAVAERLAAQ